MHAQYYTRPRRKWPWVLALVVIFLLLLGGSWYFLFQVNTFSLSMALNGKEDITLEYGESYQEPGAQPLLRGTRVWRQGVVPPGIQMEVQGTVDESTLGKYELTYTARYFGLQAQAKRQVCVMDSQCPTIVLTKMTGSRRKGESFQEPGFIAMDNYDGNITGKVRRLEAVGKITYSVIDSSGNPCVVTRLVPNFDPIPPEITLVGGETYALPLGTPYQEPGYTCTDDGDGDLTDQVTVTGEVDCWTPGTYEITYSVADSYDNETTISRFVQVTTADRAEIQWPQENTIYLTFDDGPGPDTLRLLDILDRYGVKATFFVTDGDPEILRQIVQQGHSIGIHTTTHNYSQIYASPAAFFEDLHRIEKAVFDATGIHTTLMRFPGGSSNTVSRGVCEGIMSYLTEAVQDAGYQYFDWNVDSMDAGSAQTADEVYLNVIDGIAAEGTSIVLQHDIHAFSVDAVADILDWGLSNGYHFAALEPNSPSFHHDVRN